MANGKITLGKQSGGTLGLVFHDGVSNTEVVLPESGNIASVATAVTDNAIARYDGTTGKLQNSGVIIDDTGNVGIGTGSNINAKLDVFGSIRQYNIGAGSNSTINHVNDSKNWYVGLRGDSSNAYSIADETRQRLLLDVAGNTLHLSPNGALGYGAGAGGVVTQLTNKVTAVTLNKPCGQIITHNQTINPGQEFGFFVNNNLVGNSHNSIIVTPLYYVSGTEYMTVYSVRVGVVQSNGFYLYIKNNSDVSQTNQVYVFFSIIKGSNS